MEPTDFPTPNPTRITQFSPSLANQLLSCELRVGFARDPEHKAWKRPSTYTALGVAAHSVTEAAFKRKDWPEDQAAVRELLQKLWADEIDREAAKVASAWSPATPPSPPEWPGYALTRARTIRRAMKLLAARASQQAKPSPGTGVEIELRDPDSGLFGRADRIERDAGSIRIVDLKTGLHQDEPTGEQRRQLLLYAVLVHRTSGEWPPSIAVEDASGNQYGQPLDPEVAESVLAEVLAAVASFNAAIGAGSLVERAGANAERCRWCAYRVLCQPFWESLASEWGQRSTLGSVLDTDDSPGGAFVSVTVESPLDQAGTALHVSGLPRALPAGASKVAITDWIGAPETSDVRVRWSTTVRAW